MKRVLHGDKDLQRLFAALTEQTFCEELGVADPPLIDYLVNLLIRFVRTDALYPVRSPEGKRLENVVDMAEEAEQRTARPKREVYRHIGDFTLFWAGVYPETLAKKKKPVSRDHLIDYFAQGKRSYRLASQFDENPYEEEAPVLRRLSDEFELCSYGLSCVRQDWEKTVDEISFEENSENN